MNVLFLERMTNFNILTNQTIHGIYAIKTKMYLHTKTCTYFGLFMHMHQKLEMPQLSFSKQTDTHIMDSHHEDKQATEYTTNLD